jgi:FAD/FMN-containing dehydrogenase/Fe-S oxidoreductase
MQSSFVEDSHRRPAPHGRGVDGIDSPRLERELRASIRGEVRFDDGSRALYATDGSNYRQVPIGVVLPRDVNDVLETIAACRRHHAPIVSRGGGTSLAGQCCNVAVVMDMSKYMHGILELNPEQQFARVQPGLILDHLKRAAEQHHLTFAPDPSTHDHCTIGGMIGNNSCGVHSVMGGKTVDNVITLDIALYEGMRMTVGPTSEDEYRRIIAEGGRRAEIYRALKVLAEKYADQIRQRYPDIPRRVSGYNLDDLLPEKGFNVARALVGTEGTCVTILEAKVRLIPSPPCRSLLVLGYEDVYQAAEHVPEILQKSQPTGLEGLDENLIADMKKKGLHPHNVELLPEGKGWLLVEFGGDTKKESDAKAQALMAELKTSGGFPTMKLFDDAEQEHQVWKVRESGLGATALVPGEKPTWEGWEDSAVAPENLAGYLRDLRALMNKHGYKCSLYGHFGQGCVHTRIDFDLKTENGIKNFRSFIEEAAYLVVRHGGSISGEHGDGQSKAEMLPIMFGDELVGAFREFKRIWDPGNRMNPGKVVDPYKIDQNLRLGRNYNPPALKTHFAFMDDHQSFAEATERCVGVGKCRHTEGGTMCPSFMVTREEMHSTRGRTHLLFEMLQGNPLGGGWRNEAVREALDLCLACKGCKGDCPVNVDMATYKAEFLAHYYEGRLRPLAAYSIGRIYWWARLASRMPRLANFFTQTPPMSTAFKAMGGIATGREVPAFATETFTGWFRKRRAPVEPDRPPVILWPDTFNNFLLPASARAAVEVIEAAGWQVKIPPRPLCCGRPLYDYGEIKLAKNLWRQTLDSLRDDIRAGVPLVGLEPSCVAAFRDELPNLFPQEEDARRLCEQTLTLAEFLDGKAHYQPPKLQRRALVHGHCHHRAIMGIQRDQKLLEKLGLDFKVLDSGCCGMAGSFGFEREHYDISLKIGERVLLPAVREAPRDTLIIADGFSCREQIRQCTDREALHLAQVLQMALHQ